MDDIDRARHWADATAAWLDGLLADKTRRAYRAALNDFNNYITVKLWLVTPTDLRAWLADMQARGLSAATCNQRLAAVSSLYTAICDHWIDDGVSPSPLHTLNPARAVDRLECVPFRTAIALDAHQVRALLNAVRSRFGDASSPAGVRARQHYALIAAYLLTGRRNSEVRTWLKSDLRKSSTSGWQYHWANKGGERWDELPVALFELISAYLDAAEHPFASLPAGAPIWSALSSPNFGTALATPLTGREVRRIVKQYAIIAGLPPETHVHTLRHTAADAIRVAGADIHSASRFLAHHGTAVTERYYDHRDAVPNTWAPVLAETWGITP